MNSVEGNKYAHGNPLVYASDLKMNRIIVAGKQNIGVLPMCSRLLDQSDSPAGGMTTIFGRPVGDNLPSVEQLSQLSADSWYNCSTIEGNVSSAGRLARLSGDHHGLTIILVVLANRGEKEPTK